MELGRCEYVFEMPLGSQEVGTPGSVCNVLGRAERRVHVTTRLETTTEFTVKKLLVLLIEFLEAGGFDAQFGTALISFAEL